MLRKHYCDTVLIFGTELISYHFGDERKVESLLFATGGC